MRDSFYVPENLNLHSLLEKAWNNIEDEKDKEICKKLLKPIHLDKFYYLLDHIYLQRFFGNNKDSNNIDAGNNPLVPINAVILAEVVTPDFQKFVKYMLEKCNIIEESSKPYIPGVKSKQFQFTKAYSSVKFVTTGVTDKKLLERVGKSLKKRNEIMIAEHPGKKLIRRSVENVSFDLARARQFIHGNIDFLENGSLLSMEMQLNRIEQKEHYFITDNAGGRFYHIFTNLSRHLRRFATWKDQALYSIDVCNCQPALHALLYEEDCDEKKKFVDLVSHNLFFQYINDQLKKPYDLRDPKEKGDFKKKMFHHVFFGSPYVEKTTEIANVFSDEFPNLASAIRKRKKSGKRELPVEMQGIEAKLVIDVIACELAKKYSDKDFCLISIHDCLITTETYVHEVKKLMELRFKERLSFSVLTKTEKISEGHFPNSDFVNN
jgi:hypothetical protein